MKQLSAKELATVVAKQSTGISIKFGRTNGRDVLHLIRKRNDEKKIAAASDTIVATASAWLLHPWNPERLS